MQTKLVTAALVLAMSQGMTAVAAASPEEDRQAVAALDTAFQAALLLPDATPNH